MSFTVSLRSRPTKTKTSLDDGNKFIVGGLMLYKEGQDHKLSVMNSMRAVQGHFRLFSKINYSKLFFFVLFRILPCCGLIPCQFCWNKFSLWARSGGTLYSLKYQWNSKIDIQQDRRNEIRIKFGIIWGFHETLMVYFFFVRRQFVAFLALFVFVLFHLVYWFDCFLMAERRKFILVF